MIKKTISIIALTITLIGCSEMKNQENVYLYGSKDYELKEKNAKVSFEQASNMVCSSELYRPFLQHFLIYEDDYIFTQLPPTHAGTLGLAEGVRVNSVTGEVSEINTSTYSVEHVSVGSSKALQCQKNN